MGARLFELIRFQASILQYPQLGHFIKLRNIIFREDTLNLKVTMMRLYKNEIFQAPVLNLVPRRGVGVSVTTVHWKFPRLVTFKAT